MALNPLEKRIIELSYRHKLSHVSSALNTVNVLHDIYFNRPIFRCNPLDPVVLCNSHAALALYVVLEHFGYCDNAEAMIAKHGTHASRDMENGIWVSGGSLGQPETIAVGMALANRKQMVNLVTSDGACAEGAVWEAFALASDLKLTNLHVTIIANGFGAYRTIDIDRLRAKVAAFLPAGYFQFYTPVMPFPWLEGLAGHYVIPSQEQFNEAMK